MVTHTRMALGSAFADLADDTEESVLGSSFHQDAIVDTYVRLKLHQRKHNLPWFIGNQTKLVMPRVAGPPYQPSPALLIHPMLGNVGRSSLPVAIFGPPALVIEIMRPATALSNNLSETCDLGAYAASGVTEYLAFDIFGDYIPEMVRAWRLGPTGAYAPWQPDAQQHWVSSLGIAFAPQDGKLLVYDEAGALIPSYEDREEIAEEREREIAALREELRRLRGEG
jgi:hypothetical protein